MKKERDRSFEQVVPGPGLEPFFELTEGMVTLAEATLLYELARGVPGGAGSCIVEVGSFRGRSTVALGRGSLDGSRVPVFAIEPHEEFTGVLGGKFGPPDRGAFCQAMLRTSCYHVVRLVNLSSEVVAPNWQRPVGLLWIDGDHSYAGVRRDLDCWLPHLLQGAPVAFDDATDPRLGPFQLIQELLASGVYEAGEKVGKVTVLRRKAA